MKVLEVNNLSKSFGTLEVIKDISFDVEKGEVVSVIGPSGSGKSTLLRCINQLERVSGGTITICGLDMIQSYEKGKPVYADNKTLRDIKLKMGLIFQNFNLFPHYSVLRNITDAQIHVLKRSKEKAEAVAMELLKQMGLPEKADAYPYQLSGGQQQRVSIARALALDPEILFFDEPTSALDPEMIKEVLDVMLKLAKSGMTMLLVTHEMGFAKAAADLIVFMDEGSIVEIAPPDELFSKPKSDRTKHFLEHIL